MKLKPKSIRDSILPITVLNWITGLSVLEYPVGKARPVLTFIYVFVINFVYWRSSFTAEIKPNKYITLIERGIFQVLKYVNMFIATFSVLLGWYYHKEFKNNMQRLELLDETLECSGIPKNYRRTFISSLLKTVMWIIMICVLVFSDIFFLLDTVFEGLIRCLHAVYLFHFPLHLNSIVDFTFITIINLIGMRFENINSLLESSFRMYPEQKSVGKLFTSNEQFDSIRIATQFHMKLRNNHQHVGVLILVRHLHMELSKISCDINKIYQKQMAMEMGAYFFTVTGLLYNLFTIIFFHTEALSKKYKPILSISLWCAAYGYRFVNINFTCARVSSESRKTRDVLYDLKSFNENEELNEEIDQFLLQLTQRPLTFTASGFSTLDLSFVRRFTGSLATFLVLLIQFSPQIRECE